jgi:cyclic pyranopterin phosphate synthase
VRFIEYMPTRGAQNWRSLAVTGSEILSRIGESYRLTPFEDHSSSQPARNFRIEDSAGTIGIISPVSQHFCGTCDRIRITATGFAKACLFGTGGVDLKPYLAGADAQLRDVLRQIVSEKPDRHRLTVNATENTWVAMSQIGG